MHETARPKEDRPEQDTTLCKI